MQRVEVEILVAPSCQSRRDTTAAVRRVAREAGVAVTVRERVVETIEAAAALRMCGSPTVRVGGRDVEPGAEARQDFGLG